MLVERRRQNATAKFTSARIMTRNSTINHLILSDISSTPATSVSSPTEAQSSQRGRQQLLRSESWTGPASRVGTGSSGAEAERLRAENGPSTTITKSTATGIEDLLVYMPQPCTQPLRGGRWIGRRGNTWPDVNTPLINFLTNSWLR